MTKRRRVAGDEEEPASCTLHKRARTESDEEPNDQALQERDQRRRARASDVDNRSNMSDDEADAQESQPKEIDEEKLESIYGARLHAQYEQQQRQRVGGGIAEYGIIEYVEMHQFMCHKFLKFDFGPRINFIIGHNGSGKSAVLSAITIALGGKTKFTGRGNGLKSFIREGQGASEVTIHIKNQGDDAFKHEEYGSTIIITRRFTKEGSSTWKIKNAEDKVISTRRDELSAICDHMNIQVDNPMTILTQDAARKFLSASTPKDKYKFFLRGTQLAQLEEEYDSIGKNIELIEKILAVKDAAIPDFAIRLEQAEIRHAEASMAREQEQRAINLRNELAWSHVAEKEAEMEAAILETAKCSRKLDKIAENIQQKQTEFDAASALVMELEAELQAMCEIEQLNAQKTELTNLMRDNRKMILEYNNEIGEMKTTMQTLDSQVEELNRNIEEQTRRTNLDNQAKLLETQRKIREAEEVVEAAGREIHDLNLERQKVILQAKQIETDGKAKDEQKANIEKGIKHCISMIDSAKRAETDSLIPYGNNIKQLLDKIKSTRWVGDMPLGPLGQYVKAKHPETWGHILRARLASYFLAFAITDARDRPKLKQLLMDSGNYRTNVIIFEKDMFDYRHGEPPEDIHTVLRELEINDPWVLRILINQAHIERQILADKRWEAEKTLKALRGGGNAWSLDGFGVRVFPEGGSNSFPLDLNNVRGAMNLMLAHRDPIAETSHFTEKKRQLENDHQNVVVETEGLRGQYMKLKKLIDEINNRDRQLQAQQRAARSSQTNLQLEANEEMLVDMQGLEEAKQGFIQEKESISTQLDHVAGEKNKVDQQQRTLQFQINEVKGVLNDFYERRSAHGKKIEAAVEARMRAQHDKKYYDGKLEEGRAEAEVAEANAELLMAEFNSWTAKATDFCPQIPNPGKIDDLDRQRKSLLKALDERERRGGASVEETEDQVARAKDVLHQVKKEHKMMKMFNKALKASLECRVIRWARFRSFKAIQCKTAFQRNLSNRGYFGSITFKHSAETLKLDVETDDQLLTRGTRGKDPDLLSGGEKSFATICLLLSIWECIGCPLKCLDEFDVFMDAVNRRISMKMLIDTATTSDKKQYIFITPLEIGNVTVSQTVQIHKMSDPERSLRD